MNRRTPLTALSLTATILILTGCAAPQLAATEAAPPVIEHIHGIAPDPRGESYLVATHGGLFTLTSDGTVSGPIGGHDFDAMGFTVHGDVLFASGHPGTETSPELGAPNLGLIRSDDYGESWLPVALNGTTDFHTLTVAPDGTLFGIASDSVDVLISVDNGDTWSTGSAVSAADLAATDNGVYAATEERLLLSTDNGATFTPVPDAPLLYTFDAQPDGTLAGIGTDSALWVQHPDGTWESLERLQGAAQAFTALGEDRFLVVDDRGIVEITPDATTVLAPAR